uniref:Uncharacterized protein n=1 Tax=Aegilops tauschii TaxID=37682 RepID=N1QYR4_AEGTA
MASAFGYDPRPPSSEDAHIHVLHIHGHREEAEQERFICERTELARVVEQALPDMFFLDDLSPIKV